MSRKHTYTKSPSPHLKLVALEKIDGTFWMDQCDLKGTASERLVQLQAWHSNKLGTAQQVALYMLCRRFYIELGTVGPSSAMLEPQVFQETQFETLTHSTILSRGFARPHDLVDIPDLFKRLPNFSGVRSRSGTRNVLVVGHELDTVRAFWVLGAAAALMLVISEGIRILKHQIELFAMTAVTIYGALVIVQVAVVWTNS